MSLSITLLVSASVYFLINVYNFLLIPLAEKAVPKRIPDHAPPTMQLDKTDTAFITFNKLTSIAFVYHIIQFVSLSGMKYDFTSQEEMTSALLNLPLHLVLLFVVYDFFYTLFHWALHWPPIYPLIHKHHHKQHSPFRGNVDAINVHPFEYVTGEYNHLFAIYLVSKIVGAQNMHGFTVLVFLGVGGFLASLNHTRVDLRIPYLYNVIAHDVHHAIQPRANYGQYIMLWDGVFSTFMSTEEAEKLNARQTLKDKKNL